MAHFLECLTSVHLQPAMFEDSSGNRTPGSTVEAERIVSVCTVDKGVAKPLPEAAQRGRQNLPLLIVK